MNENTATETTMVDDWDDIDLTDISDDDADQQEQPEATDTAEQTETPETEVEAETEETTTETSQTEGAEADHSFTLKHLDEVRTVTRDEVIALAQKGMDYDRVKARLDEKISAENTEAAEALDFVRSMAERSNVSVEDFMDSVVASTRAKADRSDYNEVLATVKMERREKALTEREQKLANAQTETKQQTEAESKRQADIRNFVAAFPDVKAETIPREVWNSVAKGKTLTEAYAMHEAARLKAELAAEKQNNKNKARTTGSRSTAGASSEIDEFDAAWYDGT